MSENDGKFQLKSSFGKKQSLRNVYFNFYTFCVNLLIGLYLPKYLINELGVEVYAMIPLSMSITAIMLVLTIVINGSFSRVLALSIEEGYKEVEISLNSAFWGMLIIILLLLPVSFFFIYKIDLFLDIPTGVLLETRILFIVVILGFFINSIGAIFNSVAYVKNRIDLRNISLIIHRSSILITVVALFYFNFISIAVYGIGVLIASLLSSYYSYLTFRKLLPEVKLKYSNFKINVFKEVLVIGGWMFISQVGVLLFLQSDLFIVNNFKGARESGVYGALLQWSFLLRVMVGIIAGVFGPLLLKNYTNNNLGAILRISVLSTKYLGLFMSLTISGIIFFSKEILGLWLGPDFEVYDWILIAIVFHLGWNLSTAVLNNTFLVIRKIKIPALATLCFGLLNVFGSVVLISFTDLGMIAVAISGFLALTIKNIFFNFFYFAKIFKTNTSLFYKAILPSFIVIIISVLLKLIRDFYFELQLNTISEFLAGVILYACLMFVLVIITITSRDRNYIKVMLKT